MLYANTYIVTIYTHDRQADPQFHSGQIWDVLSDNAEGYSGTGKIQGFDVFVEEPRRWTLLTRKVDVAAPIFWISRLFRRAMVSGE